MTSSGKNIRTTEALKDKTYRDAFVAAHIDNGVAFQIRTIRKKKTWTQKKLGDRADMKQERISVLEDPNKINVTLNTLRKIASAFDVALMVRFVPFGDLVKMGARLSEEALDAASFDEDPYFKPREDEISLSSIPVELYSSKIVQIRHHLIKRTEEKSALNELSAHNKMKESKPSPQQAICRGTL